MALPLARPWRSLFGHTLRERRGWSTPHGFAYCKSPRGRRFGSPVGQYCSLVLRQPVSGIACPFPHRLVSAEPRALAATRPLGHSLAVPHPYERHVYFVDSFIRWTTLRPNHTLSPTLSGHTPQWLAIYLFLPAEDCRLAFTLLSVHVRQFNWPALDR